MNAGKQEANEGETARREIRSVRAALRASWKRGCVARDAAPGRSKRTKVSRRQTAIDSAISVSSS